MQSLCYRPLDESQQQIRLLVPARNRAYPEALAFDLGACSLLPGLTPAYTTVSYCWGDPTPCRKIIVDECLLVVPEGTYRALRCIAAHNRNGRQPLYIDAICINQKDEEERASQVALMGQIYAGGKQNVIYLGEEDALTGSAVASIQSIVREIRRLTGYHETRRQELEAINRFIKLRNLAIRDTNTSIDSEAMMAFFQKAWFSRLWVLQEATLAPHSICLIGDRHLLEFKDVIDTVAWISQYLALSVSPGLRNSRGRSSAYNMWEIAWHFHVMGNISLTHALRGARRLQCADDRDRVFGVLGMTLSRGSSIPNQLRPDYRKTRIEVFRDAVRYHIEREGKLHLFESISHRPEDSIASFSWVPKFWRPLDVRLGDTSPLNLYRNTRGVHTAGPGSSSKVLLLRGYVLDRLELLSPVLFSDYHNNPAACRQALTNIASVVRDVDIDRDKLARTLLADMNHTRKQSTPADRAALPTLSRMVGTGLRVLDWYTLSPDASVSEKAAADSSTAMLWACQNRRFAVTEEHSIGLVPQVCREGDILALLTAGDKPVILRESSKQAGEYHILGECYMDGMMYDDEVKRIEQRSHELAFQIR